MEFRILGPLEVEDEGRVLKLGGAKQRGLLALLLLHPNQAVGRDRLVDELWGDGPPETAATAIQVHVSQLRKALGRDTIVTQPPGYLVRVRDGELDLERFEQLVARARAEAPTEAARLLREALALWRGLPLAELGGSVARAERVRLEEQRLSALEQRIDSDLELGRQVELVPELEGLVREHPLRERLRGQLMLALYRCGRQAEALEVYRTGRRQLDEELGLEPGEELRRLERAILEQDASLAAPAGAVPAPAQAAPTGTVTFLFTDVEGSTRLVRELGDDYGALLVQHHALLRDAFGEQGGQEIDSQGDAFFFAFRRARDAVRSAVRAQLAFAATHWPRDSDVRIRIGIHTGEPPGLVEGGYHGLDVVRAARIAGTAHGGQILVSSATRDLVGDALPDVSFRDLGEHRLEDIGHSQRIFQVVASGLQDDFPALESADAARVLTIGGREQELAVAAEAALETEERRVRLFRRSRVVAVVGGLLLAGVIAGVVVALTRGSGSSTVLVAPDSVAVVDVRERAVVDDVPIGGRPVGLAFGEGALWVTNADDGTVLRVDPTTREVVQTIGLGADVNGIAVGFGSVWVAGGNDETLYRIDPERNAVQATLRFGRADPLRPKPVFFVAVGLKSVWITRANSVLRINPATGGVTKTVLLSSTPFDLGAGGGDVWVTTRDERLVRIDEGSGVVSSVSPLPAGGCCPVVTVNALWLIVFTQTPQVWKLDPSNVSQEASVSFPQGFPAALAAGTGAVWVVGHGNGLVWRIRPAAARARLVATVASDPISVATGDGAVWIGVQQPFR